MEHPTDTTCGLRHCVNNSEASATNASRLFTPASIGSAERKLIRALVKEYGWRTTQQGILKPDHLGWGIQ